MLWAAIKTNMACRCNVQHTAVTYCLVALFSTFCLCDVQASNITLVLRMSYFAWKLGQLLLCGNHDQQGWVATATKKIAALYNKPTLLYIGFKLITYRPLPNLSAAVFIPGNIHPWHHWSQSHQSVAAVAQGMFVLSHTQHTATFIQGSIDHGDIHRIHRQRLQDLSNTVISSI